MKKLLAFAAAMLVSAGAVAHHAAEGVAPPSNPGRHGETALRVARCHGFHGVEGQVEEDLGEAVGVAQQVRDRGVVAALELAGLADGMDGRVCWDSALGRTYGWISRERG